MGYTYMPGIKPYYDKHKPVLLLHCDGADQATSFPDSSPSNHTVTAENDAQVDTAQSKFGGASCLLDGTDDYLSIPDSADWDISTNFTIDLWVKHVDHASGEIYVAQQEDIDNQWYFRHFDGTGLWFVIESATNNIVTVNEAADSITDTNWHHVAMCKVGNEYGIYNDGSQVAYLSDADMDTFAGSLYIGSLAGSQDMNGHLEEIKICHSNPFRAVPVSDKTDTIKVPTKPYSSWR